MSVIMSIQTTFIVTLISLLASCASLSMEYSDQNYSEANNPAFDDALTYADWLQDEYAIYKARPGHKAFVIAVENGDVIASGFGDNKISQQAAIREALRMCNFFSEGYGQCTLVDKAASNNTQGLSKKTIEDAPKVLISYRDIKNYHTYLQAKPPKAFATASGSGEGFWVVNQTDVTEAKKQALKACDYGRHEADPICSIIHSE